MVDFPDGDVGGKRVVVEERATGRGEIRWGWGAADEVGEVGEGEVDVGGRTEEGMGPRSSSSTVISDVSRREGVSTVGGREEGKRLLLPLAPDEGNAARARLLSPLTNPSPPASGELRRSGLMRMALVSTSPKDNASAESSSSRARKGMGLKMGVLA